MITKKTFIYVVGVLSFFVAFTGNATYCSIELPPNEQIILNGKQRVDRVLSCKIVHNGQGNDYFLNFFSETNASTVNNLLMPEGTLMSLSYEYVHHDAFNFKLKPKAKLNITNDSADFLWLKCSES